MEPLLLEARAWCASTHAGLIQESMRVDLLSRRVEVLEHSVRLLLQQQRDTQSQLVAMSELLASQDDVLTEVLGR